MSSTASRVEPSTANTRSTSPPTCAAAAPIAFATEEWSGRTTSDAEGSFAEMRIAPPPTSTTGNGAALVFMRSTATSAIL